MGIDRKRVEELKGRTPPSEMPVRNTADLLRACKACRTAGELFGMWGRVYRHMGRHGLIDSRNRKRGLLCTVEEEATIGRIAGAVANAELLPPGTPIGPEYWSDEDL